MNKVLKKSKEENSNQSTYVTTFAFWSDALNTKQLV